MNWSAVLTAEFWRTTAYNAIPYIVAIGKIVIIFLFIRAVANKLVERVIRVVTQRETRGPTPGTVARAKTLGTLIKSVISYVLIFIAGVMILEVFKVNIAPVLTTAGVAGLAIGFGAQRLVRDVISGFFIVLENQYAVGDYVTIGTVSGTVEELGMRVTKIRDDVGKLVFISNGDVTLVTNHSRGTLQASMDVSVASNSDLEMVRALIEELGKKVADEIEGIISPPRVDGITAVDATKVVIRITGVVEPGRQEAMQTALRKHILEKAIAGEIKLV
ncbi:MAG: mechanosensitive ion channel [Armatimonadota bacterium]|nr:mechanosensitive ion channel [Armatimonadota bacterium]